MSKKRIASILMSATITVGGFAAPAAHAVRGSHGPASYGTGSASSYGKASAKRHRVGSARRLVR
jgi:hypothetical protein